MNPNNFRMTENHPKPLKKDPELPQIDPKPLQYDTKPPQDDHNWLKDEQ